ncbi:MAG: hypothetical protein L3J20_07185 [Flavobacteriaceae bacterium]|nr:hypothetical protein [Flavobacteriaceae bacterium]
MNEKKKIKKVKKSNFVPEDIARLYEVYVIQRLKEKVNKEKVKNEKKSKELINTNGTIRIIRFS